MTWISPKYKDTDFPDLRTNIDHQIDVFVDRISGWQLDIAKFCKRKKHAGVAILSILLSYFETIGNYRTGDLRDNQSRFHFSQGVKYVFPELFENTNYSLQDTENFVNLLYKDARCGLYHSSSLYSSIILEPTADKPLQMIDQIWLINHKLLVDSFIENLKKFEMELRNPKNNDLRKKFSTKFLWDFQSPEERHKKLPSKIYPNSNLLISPAASGTITALPPEKLS